MSRRRALGMVFTGVAAAVAMFVSAGSAAAYSSWTRESGWSSYWNGTSWVNDCHGFQNILEGYNGSSHEYQQGSVSANPGITCEVCITQYINGNKGATNCSDSGYGGVAVTEAYYDGPGYQDTVAVYATNVGLPQAWQSSLY